MTLDVPLGHNEVPTEHFKVSLTTSKGHITADSGYWKRKQSKIVTSWSHDLISYGVAGKSVITEHPNSYVHSTDRYYCNYIPNRGASRNL